MTMTIPEHNPQDLAPDVRPRGRRTMRFGDGVVESAEADRQLDAAIGARVARYLIPAAIALGYGVYRLWYDL